MDLQSAKSRLVQELGGELISFEEKVITKYASAINGSVIRPFCIATPQNESQIISLLAICREYHLCVYTLSKGKNFGYGDALGTAPGQVILDLGLMNKIVNVDATLAYATIQPGVTQQQLANFLRENKIPLQLDVTGAGLDASIVGNILERGFGHSDYGDRFSRIVRLKILLADGTVIETGFGAYKNAKAINTYRYGVGPILDGVFSQSNFGIITELTFELMPQPEALEMFIFSTKNPQQLSSLVDTVRRLRLDGVVNSAIHIANKARAVGEKENKLAGAWNASGSITGPATLVNAKKKVIKQYFRKYCNNYRLVFINEFRLKLLRIAERVLKIPVYDAVKSVFDLQKGVPTDDHIRTLLNNDSITSASIQASSLTHFFEWINAVCPSDSKSVDLMIKILSDLFQEANYEFRVTLTAVNPRTFILISNITFSNVKDEMDRAYAFKKKCYATLAAQGFFPYRSGSGSFDILPEYDANLHLLLQKIKKVMDPHGILAPGKYNI